MKVSSIVKTPIVRKAVAGAMMMTAVLGSSASVNAKPIDNNKTINQTEVLSSEGSLALANLFVQSPTYSTAKNQKLDNLYLSIMSNNEAEKARKASELNSNYTNYGTFVTAILSEANMVDKLLNQDILKSEEGFNSIYTKAKTNNKFKEYGMNTDDKTTYWNVVQQSSSNFDNLNKVLLNKLSGILQNGKPSYEDCSKMLDNLMRMVVSSDEETTYDESILKRYTDNVKIYNDMMNHKYPNNPAAKAEVIAYQVFYIYKTYANTVFKQYNLHPLFFSVYDNTNRTNRMIDVILEKANPADDILKAMLHD